MYERITDENPYKVPMRIYPAIHYTMGGLWVDYNLMTTIPGLYAIGEANFSDHGANRLGASALMQGLADGYFVLPYTIGNYLAGAARHASRCPPTIPSSRRPRRTWPTTSPGGCRVGGTQSVDHYHRELGKHHVGLLRHGPRPGRASRRPSSEIPALRDEFQKDVRVLGAADTVNQSLEKVQRVADFFELAELMCRDALHREECCGGHFRVEHQTEEGEAQRDDEHFAYVGAWEWTGPGHAPGAAQGTARVRVRPPDPEELQVTPRPRTGCHRSCTTSRLQVWRQDGPERRRAASRPTRPRTSTTTCRSSRCSTSSTSG